MSVYRKLRSKEMVEGQTTMKEWYGVRIKDTSSTFSYKQFDREHEVSTKVFCTITIDGQIIFHRKVNLIMQTPESLPHEENNYIRCGHSLVLNVWTKNDSPIYVVMKYHDQVYSTGRGRTITDESLKFSNETGMWCVTGVFRYGKNYIKLENLVNFSIKVELLNDDN